MELTIISNDDEWSTDSGLFSSSSYKSSTNDDYDSTDYETAESGDDVESVYHSARSDSSLNDKSPKKNSSLSEALQRTARRMSEEHFLSENGPPAPFGLLRQWIVEGVVGGEQILKYIPRDCLIGRQLKVAAQFFHVMNASTRQMNHVTHFQGLLMTHRSNSCPDLLISRLRSVENVWPSTINSSISNKLKRTSQLDTDSLTWPNNIW
ncbi:unnamed protein product [Dimorphilus gyrociliatus]|uniref:Uncharacterized protein n=1 Tax=Dimorphilus gyrociliatus TaxID=2664684 RepID=A0A7I8WCW1_9ANNE|nr:unnamed protein product [Dimorphilus gyrociliatus]